MATQTGKKQYSISYQTRPDNDPKTVFQFDSEHQPEMVAADNADQARARAMESEKVRSAVAAGTMQIGVLEIPAHAFPS